jgi:hypothetical protein
MLTVVAFTAVLAATIFLTVETFKGVLEYTIRVLENCTPPCVIGPPPPEPLEKRIVTRLLIAAFAVFDIFLIKEILW